MTLKKDSGGVTWLLFAWCSNIELVTNFGIPFENQGEWSLVTHFMRAWFVWCVSFFSREVKLISASSYSPKRKLILYTSANQRRQKTVRNPVEQNVFLKDLESLFFKNSIASSPLNCMFAKSVFFCGFRYSFTLLFWVEIYLNEPRWLTVIY